MSLNWVVITKKLSHAANLVITEFIHILLVYIHTWMYVIDLKETPYHLFFLHISIALYNELCEVYEQISLM